LTWVGCLVQAISLSSHLWKITLHDLTIIKTHCYNVFIMHPYLPTVYHSKYLYQFFIHDTLRSYAKSRIRMSLGLCGLKVTLRQESHKSKTFLTHKSGSWYSLCDTIKLLIRLDPMASVYLRWGGLGQSLEMCPLPPHL